MRILLSFLAFAAFLKMYSQTGINTVLPDQAAALDIHSTLGTDYGGLKLPTITPAQRSQIAVNSSSDGLLIYVIDGTFKCLEIYDGLFNNWQKIYCNPATVLFTENFESYAVNTGVSGTGTTGDYPTGVTKWNLDTSFTNLADSNDYGQVRNGVFEIQDTNGVLIFTTQTIDLSSVTLASFSIEVSEMGDLEYNPAQHISDTNCDTAGTFSDFLDVQYSLDNGATFIEVPSWQGLGTVNHTFADDFTSATVQVANISATSIIIRVLMQNWAAGEMHRIDNITVLGQ